ncbi:MAG: CHASE domain-containing protein [Verrucomicrobiales bacterium]|nr:CHASE domain-containing protein [Verrucomicrobiales bacterium]
MSERASIPAPDEDRRPADIEAEAKRHTTTGWAVLALGALCTVVGWNHARDDSRDRAAERFRFQTLEARLAISDRIDAYQAALRSAKGLILSTGSVNRRQWQAYVSTLDINRHYPGIQGLGVAVRVTPEKLERHIAGVRAEGFPEYQVHPPGTRDEYFPVFYLEPFEGRNLRAFGFDMFAEEVRRAAMNHARDTGDTTLSGKVRLIQESDDDVQPGSLMYEPVYTPGADLDSLEARRKHLLGFTFAPFRSRDLMEGILGRKLGELSLAIYDGETAGLTNLLYSTRAPESPPLDYLTSTFTINQCGRPWTIVMGASQSFLSRDERQNAPLAAASGIAVTLLVFAITWSLSNTRQNALRLARDMTRRLEASCQELRSVTDSANVPILTIDAQGAIDYLNPCAARTFQYPAEALLGRPLSVLLPDVQPGSPSEANGAAKLQARRRDGSTFPAELQLSRRSTPGAACYTAILRDTSERDLAEALHRERESNLRQFIHDTPVPVAMFDREMRYLMASQRWIREFNPPEPDVIGKCHYDLFPDTPQPWRDAHQNCLAGGTAISEEDPYPRQDDTVDWFRWEIRPWREARGQVGGLIVFAEFITQRKRAEEDARRAALQLESTNQSLEQAIDHAQQLAREAETANCAKSLFLASMSHEIRTPMNGILGFAGILRNTPLNSKQKEYVDVIQQSGDALLTLINDILDFSKIEANRMELIPAPFDLRLCLEDCVKLLLPRALEKDLHLNLSLAPDLPPTLIGDANRIRQVILNLLSNAVKFTHAGSVDVLARPIALSRDRTRVQICVRDTGIGIAPDNLARLFQPFSQADPSIHVRFGGTGLGLVISKRLAEAMGGSLTIESTEGAGSTFTFVAELGIETNAPPAPSSLPSPAHAPLTPAMVDTPRPPALSTRSHPTTTEPLQELAILVAEDNPVNRDVVVLYLKQLGFHADLAENGREAVERTQHRQYDLILMDLHMPELDGLGATHQILSRPSTVPLPAIVALTASVTREDEEACRAAGMRGFLNKPLHLADLRDVVQRVANGQLPQPEPPPRPSVLSELTML